TDKIEIARGGVVGDVVIPLDRARTVAGHVRAAGGAAIAGARVELARLHANTNARGDFRIEGVLPGHYRLIARASGKAPLAHELLVAAEDLENVDLVLPEGAEIWGRVVGRRGEASEGALV